MHPRSLDAIGEFWNALALERLSIGIVQPHPGSERGRGWWQTDLSQADFMRALPRAAAANVNGAHVYVRVPTTAPESHCGVILLDDLSRDALHQLTTEGWEPCAVTKTSPANFQAWLRLGPPGAGLERGAVQSILGHLIKRAGADPRACSPMQPGRLVGFTNRKRRYADASGRFPIVRLIDSRPGHVCSAAAASLEAFRSQEAQPAAPRAAPRKTPQAAVLTSGDARELDRLRDHARRLIADQLRAGQRPPERASESEIDWMTVCCALRAGWSPDAIEAWLQAARPERDPTYVIRTVSRATDQVLGATGFHP
jgi:hypothetical protein